MRWFQRRPVPSPALPFAVGPLGSEVAPGAWQGDPVEQLRHYRSWVYAAVNAIAQEVARQRPIAYRNAGQAAHQQTLLGHDHPLVRLLDRPNPWLTPWELWYLTIVYLELNGNCYWYAPPSEPAEIWIIPTPWVRVIPDAVRYVAGYEVSVPGLPAERLACESVIHLKYPNPLDVHTGLSPLQANALTVDAHTELLKSRCHAFRAGQRPGVVLSTDQTLHETTVRRLEQTVRERFAGRENWHRPLVLEQGLKANPWTLTPAEMDFLNSSRMTRDEILAVFRVPAAIAGIIENSGLGGEIWNGARTMFCEGTVQPKLELIAQCLTRDLASRYGPELFLLFPDCSPRNHEARRKDDELDAKLGLRTVNEIRKARGLPPYADARFDAPL